MRLSLAHRPTRGFAGASRVRIGLARHRLYISLILLSVSYGVSSYPAEAEIRSYRLTASQSQDAVAVEALIDSSEEPARGRIGFRMVPGLVTSSRETLEIDGLSAWLGSEPVRIVIDEESPLIVAGSLHLPADAEGKGNLRVLYRVVAEGATEDGCLRLAVPLVTLDGLQLVSTPELFQASLRLERSYERYETFPTEHALVPSSGLDWTLPVPPSHLRVVGCDARRSVFASFWLDRLAILVLVLAALAAVMGLRRS